MLVDLDGDELLAYRSDQKDPPDFDRFWARTLGEARGFDSSAQLALMDSPINGVDIFDMSFSGYGGQRISAWLRTPKAIDAQLPVIVEFVGYGGGRGFAEDSLFWSACGFAHLQMDTRGQGATWSVGSTPDVATAGPRVPGMMTSGIENRDDYYYRRLITDAVRAIDAVRTIEFIDPARITSFGVSQGGGLALAAAALVPEVSSLATYLPFLCDFPRAILVTDSDPYKEISRYLAVHQQAEENVLNTLSYFDGVNFAKRAHAPAWFTTALMDSICPPSTVVGAYHAYAGEKQLTIHTHNGHEHGTDEDVRLALELRRLYER